MSSPRQPNTLHPYLRSLLPVQGVLDPMLVEFLTFTCDTGSPVERAWLFGKHVPSPLRLPETVEAMGNAYASDDPGYHTPAAKNVLPSIYAAQRRLWLAAGTWLIAYVSETGLKMLGPKASGAQQGYFAELNGSSDTWNLNIVDATVSLPLSAPDGLTIVQTAAGTAALIEQDLPDPRGGLMEELEFYGPGAQEIADFENMFQVLGGLAAGG